MKDLVRPAFYSNVLFQFASQNKSEEKYLQELQRILEIFEKNESLRQVLFFPIVSDKEKQRVLRRIFNNQFDETIVYVLEKLMEQNSLDLLPAIIDSFSSQLRQKQGILDIELIVPEPLNEENKRALQEKLIAAYGKQVELHEKIDRQTIGGMVLLFPNNKMLDYSLKTKLNQLQDNLKRSLSRNPS